MNPLDTIHRWRHSRMRDGDKPDFVPLTREEFLSIQSDMDFRAYDPRKQYDQVAGMKVFETPYAEEMRQRQIELPQVAITESATLDLRDNLISHTSEDNFNMALQRRLTAHICTDTTHIDIEVECDPWKWMKTILRLTKWFPIRTKKFRICGRVLYPYLKVQLPANRHHVRFNVMS